MDNEIKTFKSMVFLGDIGEPQFIDTIWHENYWWLVATWLQDPATGHRIPERIIQMDGTTVRFQEERAHTHRFLVNNSIPISVFDGIPHTGYVVSVYPVLSRTQGPTSTH